MILACDLSKNNKKILFYIIFLFIFLMQQKWIIVINLNTLYALRDYYTLNKERKFAYNTNRCSSLGWGTMHMRTGQTVEMVYLDQAGKITQRIIEVKRVQGGRIRATCLATGEPRVFLAANILAWRPVTKRHVVR